jgi:hypothetical protein
MSEAEYGDRFPGFEVMDQRRHWDRVTAAVIGERLEPRAAPSAFTDSEQRTVELLVGLLLDLDTRISGLLALQIGQRLEAGETDGWHYDDMPEDVVAWRRSLSALDEEARLRADLTFSSLDRHSRHRILAGVNGAGQAMWHGMTGSKVWNMWLRYACTAYYAHPEAWNEIGFPGPAYPRGYKNAGVDRREPFEVADAGPVLRRLGPVRTAGRS